MSDKYKVGSDEDVEFGRRLEQAMKDKRVKNRKLAFELNLSPAVIHKYVYGISVPRVNTFAEIIKVLGLTPIEAMYILSAFTESEGKDG